MFFRQIEVGNQSVFAYLIGDPESGEAVVVDPADDVIELIELAQGNNLRIQSIVNTHGHVDHIMGNAEMKENTGLVSSFIPKRLPISRRSVIFGSGCSMPANHRRPTRLPRMEPASGWDRMSGRCCILRVIPQAASASIMPPTACA